MGGGGCVLCVPCVHCVVALRPSSVCISPFNSPPSRLYLPSVHSPPSSGSSLLATNSRYLPARRGAGARRRLCGRCVSSARAQGVKGAGARAPPESQPSPRTVLAAGNGLLHWAAAAGGWGRRGRGAARAVPPRRARAPGRGHMPRAVRAHGRHARAARRRQLVRRPAGRQPRRRRAQRQALGVQRRHAPAPLCRSAGRRQALVIAIALAAACARGPWRRRRRRRRGGGARALGVAAAGGARRRRRRCQRGSARRQVVAAVQGQLLVRARQLLRRARLELARHALRLEAGGVEVGGRGGNSGKRVQGARVVQQGPHFLQGRERGAQRGRGCAAPVP